MKKIYLVFALLLVSVYGNAAVTESGIVKNIIMEGNVVSFWLSGPDDTSECSGGARWTLLETDGLYKEKFSALLASAASGKTVHVRSTGACGSWDSNSVYYINFEN